MNGFVRVSATRSKQLAAASALLILTGLEPKVVSGAAIRHSASAEIRSTQAWSRYVLAGPSVWSSERSPTFSAAVRRMIWSEVRASDATASPMVSYFLWRRGLRPQRFDHYHPSLGPILSRLPEIPRVTPSPQGIIPSTSPIIPPTPLTEPNVPEPAPILLALGMAIWAIRAKKRLAHVRPSESI